MDPRSSLHSPPDAEAILERAVAAVARRDIKEAVLGFNLLTANPEPERLVVAVAGLEATLKEWYQAGQLETIGLLGRVLELTLLRRFPENPDILRMISFFYRRAGRHADVRRMMALREATLEHLNAEHPETGEEVRYLDIRSHAGTIGEAAMRLGLVTMATELGLWPRRRWRIVLPPETKVANPLFLDHWRGRFEFVAEAPGTEGLELPVDLGPGAGDEQYYIDKSLGFLMARWEAEGRGAVLSLDPGLAGRGEAALREMGVPDGAWFACLHVREHGYHSDPLGISRVRDVRVETYLEAVRAATERGGWVIRLGHPTMTPLPPMEKVIDYPFTAFRSDAMDLFLAARARFFIGTASGMFIVASLFGTPVVLTNQIPLSERSYSPRDVVIFKHYRDRDGRRLRFEEAMLPPLQDNKSARDLEAAGIGWEDNTAEEVHEAVVEMMDALDGRREETPEDADLRARFDRLTDYAFGLPVARPGAAFLRRWKELL